VVPAVAEGEFGTTSKLGPVEVLLPPYPVPVGRVIIPVPGVLAVTTPRCMPALPGPVMVELLER